MVASRWVWGLLGSAVMFSGTGTAAAQELPPTPILLAQTEQKTEADVLFDEAIMLYELQTAEGYQQAIEKWKAALILYEQQNNQVQAAVTNLAIGFLSNNLGFKQKAIISYNQALLLYQAIEDRGGEATSLNNIGQVYDDLGEKQEALDYYQQALLLWQAIEDRRGEATTLNNIGLVYDDLGEKQQALDYYQQSLPLLRTVSDRRGEARLLSNIGQVYNDLGEKQQALDYHQQALPLLRIVGDRRGEATTLNNIGQVYDALGKKQQAFNYYQQALPLSRAVGDRTNEARLFNNIGAVYKVLGEKQQALDYYQQALPLSRAVGDREGEANTLNNIGTVYDDLGEKQQALDYYNQALPLLRAVGDRNGEAITFHNLGFLLKEEEPELAIIFYKQSVNLYETLRKDIEQLDSDIQQTYLSTIEDTYRNLADLLLQENRVFEAQRVLDLLKVQELDGIFGNVQVRSGTDELGIFHRSPEADFLERYNDQLRQEIALGEERTKLIALSQTVGLTETQNKRFRELERLQNSESASLQAFLNQDDIQKLILELRANFAENDPTLDLNQRSDLRDILQSLEQQGQKAAFLYPFILGDRLELVLITSSTNAISRSVKISRPELNQLIINAGTALKDRNSVNSDYTALEALHEVLITPIEAALDEAGIETIVYAPDGALRYIPLAALRNKAEQNWLIDKYQVNNITALSLKTFGRPAPQRLSIFAGAFASGKHNVSVEVSNGQRQGVREEPFTGLPYAGKEVEAIAQVAQTTTKIDDEFNSDIVQDFNLYTVIHLATHAKFLPETPRDSFMVFGNGEHLSLRQMEEEHFVFGDAPLENKWQLTQQQLVVLSACETALGSDLNPDKLKETNSGIEILGLGYQWQRQGARATMASLWQVQDDSTQVLMTEFYRNLGKGNISSAEALRQAQATLSQDPTYAHPYHWASFVLIGNGL